MTQEIVRALVDGVWVTEVANQGGSGCSQPFLDLGTVTVASLIASGPPTLYTPSAGEFVCVYFAAGVNVTSAWQIIIEPFFTFSNGGVYWGVDESSAQDMVFVAGNADTKAGFFFPASVVKAHLYTGNAPVPISTAVGTWQANHAYALGAAVLDGNGNVQVVTTAGTSGGSEPTWDTDPNDPTTDNDVTWTNGDVPPAVGSVHLVALTGVPVAP